MKAHVTLQAQMRDAYERFQNSQLSQKVFCQSEGISKGKFNYWCRQFKQMPIIPLITTEKTNTQVEKKEKPYNEPSGFTPLSLPITQTPTPLTVLVLAAKGRLEFYSPVEASFLRALIN
jgi:hypothetical protein